MKKRVIISILAIGNAAYGNAMTHLTSIWSAQSTVASTALILPDGCQDLIVKIKPGEAPTWSVSPLYNHAKTVGIDADTFTLGFRLKPGVSISEAELLARVTGKDIDIENMKSSINDLTQLNASVEEALQCLASSTSSVSQAASDLGVSIRTLQRLLVKGTARSPSYWFQLARVRKAAQLITVGQPLIDVADQYGFSDQSHMCREFQRWFHRSPTEMMSSSELTNQVIGSGYGCE